MPGKLSGRTPRFTSGNFSHQGVQSFNPGFALSNSLPIYVQLVTVFRGLIENEKWQVGNKIPALEELAEEFGVARATVRQAIGFLEQEGLIERHRGRGTHVINKPRHDVWYKIPGDWQALIHVSDDTESEWVADEIAREPPRPSHEGGTFAPAYQFTRRVHRRDGVPYLIGSSYVDKRLFDRVSPEDFNRYGTFRVLDMMDDVTIARADQTVVVGMADADVAHHLEIPLNSPVAIVRRSVFDGSEVLICEAEGIYRGDFVKIEAQLV